MASPAALSLTADLKPGDHVDRRYVVVRRLGEGGCGAVYHCTFGKDGPPVAVKLLENRAETARFEREVEMIQSTRSRFVVGYRHHGQHLHFPYLAMEFCAGGSLRDHVTGKGGKLPMKEAAWIVCLAIQGLIDAGTVHRDLKPENLLVVPDAAGKTKFRIGDDRNGAVVKVADFGLAKAFDPSLNRLTRTGQIMGTPLYMSPEQCRNTKDVTQRADIYALGIILCELVTGDVPFEADDAYSVMEMHQRAEPRLKRMDRQMEAG